MILCPMLESSREIRIPEYPYFHLNSAFLKIGLWSKLFSKFHIRVMRFTEGFFQYSQLLVCEGCSWSPWGTTSFLLSGFQNDI